MDIGTLVILLLALGTLGLAVEFLITYHRRSRGKWREDPAGKAIMLLAFGLAMFMASALVRVIDRDILESNHPAFRAVVVATFVLVPLSLLWFRRLMGRVMKRPADE